MSGLETREQKGPGAPAALGSEEQHPSWPASQMYLPQNHGDIFVFPTMVSHPWIPNHRWEITVFDLRLVESTDAKGRLYNHKLYTDF